MKKLILALLIVAFLAMPAFASVQNIKVSGDVNATWLYRQDFDFSKSSKNRQNDVLSFMRLRVDADLTDNVSAVIRLLNERAWGDDDASDTAKADNFDVELDLAYIEMREMLYSPLTVTIGRQVLHYGNGLLIGAGGPNNSTSGGLINIANDMSMRTGIDAIKAVLDYDPLTIDMFAAIIDANQTGFIADTKRGDDSNLFGINAAYNLGDKYNSALEAYVFAIANKVALPQNVLSDNTDSIVAPGLRATTNLMDGLFLSGEVAWQFGKDYYGTNDYGKREAMAVQLISSYALPFEKTKEYNPVITGVYTYLSGDKDLTSGKSKAWDPMLETQASGKIYNTLFNLSNAHIVELSASAQVIEDVMAKLTWTGLWLDEKLASSPIELNSPAYYEGSAPSNTYAVKTNKKSLGSEVDLDLTYSYTEDVTFGLSTGWFMPGSLFTSANDDTAYQMMSSVSVAF